jgi:hypothetical protein
LLGVSSLAAVAVERMGASLHLSPAGWPASGCLEVSVVQLGAYRVDGRGSLCITDSAMQGTLDLRHLEPLARFAGWVAYFESPGVCSGAPLMYQIATFNEPCTLVDLEGPQPHGIARELGEWPADAEGDLHLDAPMPGIEMRSHAQVWLLLTRPAWSPIPPYPRGITPDESTKPVARAVFQLP